MANCYDCTSHYYYGVYIQAILIIISQYFCVNASEIAHAVNSEGYCYHNLSDALASFHLAVD